MNERTNPTGVYVCVCSVYSLMHSVRGCTGHERTWIDKIADRRLLVRYVHSNTRNFSVFVVSDIKIQSALRGSQSFLVCVRACMSVCQSIAWSLRWLLIFIYQSRPFDSACHICASKPLAHFANHRHHQIFDTLFAFYVIDFALYVWCLPNSQMGQFMIIFYTLERVLLHICWADPPKIYWL